MAPDLGLQVLNPLWHLSILKSYLPPFAPIPGNDISSSMKQTFIKTRVIINKNKKQKHVAFYFVVYVCMQQSL